MNMEIKMYCLQRQFTSLLILALKRVQFYRNRFKVPLEMHYSKTNTLLAPPTL